MPNVFNLASSIKRVAPILCIGALLLSLTGCAEIMIGTAVVTAVSATDRRTAGTQAEDTELVVKGKYRAEQIVGSAGQVEVTCFNRRLLLTGTVVSAELRQEVEQALGKLEGALGVVNELEIGPFAQGFGSRANDALITTKVKTALLNDAKLPLNVVKVTTANATVYLMGRVTQTEADAAGEAARMVGGVARVIKLFQLISDTDLVRQ